MKHIKLLIAFTIFISTQSCKKFLDADAPIDQLSSAVVFTEEKTATAAVLGMYTSMMPSIPIITSGGTTLYAGLSADELYSSNISNASSSEFSNNALSPNNGELVSVFWLRGYNIIYQANACIEGLENNTHISESVRDQLLGEALFNRAFIYYYLVNLFGDVPLLLNTNYEKNSAAPRTTSSIIYDQIINDLKEAQHLLKAAYPTTDRVRPNKWTATALLARVYLTLGQWSLAEQESSAVINSDDYFLETSLDNVFLASSMEAIWQLMPVEEGFNTTEGITFVPSVWSSGIPDYPITQYLLNAFEVDDVRKASWVASKSVDGDTYYYPFKYKINEYGLPVTEYYTVFRLAEQYLIRAESYAHQEKMDEAKNDLDIIRQRAGLPGTLANTDEELIEAIAQERRIEFFAEWGHRWFDLKRTKKSTEVLGIIKPGWQATDTLYPIPLSEILANKNLTQNQGY